MIILKKTKKLTAINSVPDVPIVSSAKVKSYKHPNKAFSLKDLNTSLFLKNGWEIAEGGTATDNQTDEITSFPAVIQYLDTKNTITVTVADECAEKDSFLAKQRIPIFPPMAILMTALKSLNLSAFLLINLIQ